MKELLPNEKSLNSRLAAYAATSGALLAIGSIASGQVHYSGVQNILVNVPTDPYELDIDVNGTNDFLFGIALNSTFWNTYTSYNSAFVRQAGTISYINSWMGGPTNNVSDLAAGDEIAGAIGSWRSSGNTWNLGSNYNGAHYGGPFPGQGNKFLGVRFYAGAEMHYGWVRLNIPTLVNQITIVDWAYQETANARLFTGDFEGPVGALATNVLARTNIKNAVVTITFNEKIEGLSLTDFTVVNGIASNLIEVTPGLQYTVQVSAEVHGNVLVTLNAETVNDLSLNLNEAAASVNWFYDNKVPTVALTPEIATLTNEKTQTVTIVFSEEVLGMQLTDFSLTNCTVANLVTVVANKEFTVDVTAVAEGNVVLTLPAASIVDYGNNPNALTSVNWMYDATAPVATLAPEVTGLTSDEVITVQVTFSEEITGLEAGDFVVTNGTAGSLNVVTPGLVYQIDITNTADGPVTLELSAGAVEDLAGNPIALTQASWTYDGTAPVLTLSSGVDVTGNQTVTVTLNTTEPLFDLDITDIVVTNGTVSGFNKLIAPWAVFTFDVTATAEGEVTVDIAGGAATDEAGNPNAAVQTSWTYDSSLPGVSLTNASGSVSGDATETVTITFTEPVSGLEIGDFAVTNGTASGLTETSPGLEYTITVTATGDGDVTVELPAAAVTDDAGNENDAASVSWAYDGTAPIAYLTTELTEPTENQTVTVSVTFSEEISGLTVSDFDVTNGVASNLVTLDAGISYTVDITAIAVGEVTVELPSSSVTDEAGNVNAAVSVSYTYETEDAVENLTDANIRLYPNPANSLLNIETDQEATVRITFLTGKTAMIIERVNSEAIDISGLPSGVYLVHIETADGIAIREFVKE
jgi:hypothetical protein